MALCVHEYICTRERGLLPKNVFANQDDEMDVLMAAAPARCIKENTKKLERERARVRALEDARAKELRFRLGHRA